MPAVCLRYFNVYGPRQDPSSEYSGVIARFMDAAARRATARRRGGVDDAPSSVGEGPPYVVYGDGRQSRDFVFVADVVAANLLALDACLGGRRGAGVDVDGAVVNVGTGLRVDLLQIIAEIERLTGSPGEARIDFRPPREGDIRASQADIARARQLLRYEPAVSFADGLAATYRWHATQCGPTR
jgi:UDP-glucose 4-epimerase